MQSIVRAYAHANSNGARLRSVPSAKSSARDLRESLAVAIATIAAIVVITAVVVAALTIDTSGNGYQPGGRAVPAAHHQAE